MSETRTAPHVSSLSADRLSSGLLAEKVHPWHRERLAIVYVRQSTVQQVVDHQESTRLQYGLRIRAQELGWAADRVMVIDDDLGKSGATTEGRDEATVRARIAAAREPDDGE